MHCPRSVASTRSPLATPPALGKSPSRWMCVTFDADVLVHHPWFRASHARGEGCKRVESVRVRTFCARRDSTSTYCGGWSHERCDGVQTSDEK